MVINIILSIWVVCMLALPLTLLVYTVMDEPLRLEPVLYALIFISAGITLLIFGSFGFMMLHNIWST